MLDQLKISLELARIGSRQAFKAVDGRCLKSFPENQVQIRLFMVTDDGTTTLVLDARGVVGYPS